MPPRPRSLGFDANRRTAGVDIPPRRQWPPPGNQGQPAPPANEGAGAAGRDGEARRLRDMLEGGGDAQRARLEAESRAAQSDLEERIRLAREQMEEMRDRRQGPAGRVAELARGTPPRAWLQYALNAVVLASLVFAAGLYFLGWELPGFVLTLLIPTVLVLHGFMRLWQLIYSLLGGVLLGLLLASGPLLLWRRTQQALWRYAFIVCFGLLPAFSLRRLAPPSMRNPAIVSDEELWFYETPVNHAGLYAYDHFTTVLDGVQVWRHFISSGIPEESKRDEKDNLYQTLGVSPLADEEQIEEAAARLGLEKRVPGHSDEQAHQDVAQTIFFPFETPPKLDIASRVQTAVKILTNDLYRCVYDAKNDIVGQWYGWDGACYELWHREAEKMRQEQRKEVWLELGFTEEVIEAAEARRASILEPRTRRRQEEFEKERSTYIAANWDKSHSPAGRGF